MLTHTNYGRTQKTILRCHNSISITASRGAGKTTFLFTALNRIRKQYGSEVLVLDPIDPSLIEMKQHPFINIIATIQKSVEYVFKGNDYSSVGSDLFQLKNEYDWTYKELLKALPLIDGVGKPGIYDDWDDSEFISLQGMQRVEASIELEKLFHSYVSIVLRLLHKKCIVISFDDIDSDFKKGFEILETIRKYLTTCQVIPIITGDLELYCKLIRKSTWTLFDTDYLEKEIKYSHRDSKEFSLMVDQLENQYLVKLLKPENRILLKSVSEYIQNENYDISVVLNKGVSLTLHEVYRLCIQFLGFGKLSSKQENEIIHFFLGLTLRIQIRMLSSLNNSISQENSSVKSVAAFTDTFMNVFWNDLYQKSSNAKSLFKNSQDYVMAMLKFLIENGVLFSSSNFLPETSDQTLNKALFIVGARYNSMLYNHNFMIFDYWMRISYVKVVTERMGGLENATVIEKLLRYTSMDTDSGLIKSYGLAQAFCNLSLNGPFHEMQDVLSGTIYLGSQPPHQLMDSNQFLALLPLLGTVDGANNEYVFLSIYQLLAVLRDGLYSLSTETENRILLNLNKFAQYRSFQEPYVSARGDLKKIKTDDVRLLTLEGEKSAFVHNLISDIKKWNLSLPDVSVQLLDRVFTRFYYTMIHLDSEKKSVSFSNPVDLFSNYILALLNAALVEDAIDKNIDELNFNNMGDIERIYLNNLRTFESKKTKSENSVDAGHSRVLFSDWLMQCPLFKLFIKPEYLEILNARHSKEIENIEELLMYHRNSDVLDSLRAQRKSLEDKKEHCQSDLDWMDDYFTYHSIDDELQFLLGINLEVKLDVSPVWKQIQELKRNKTKLRQELTHRINSKGFAFTTERDIVEREYNQEIRNRKELLDEIKTIDSEIAEKEKASSAISPWVKKRHEMTFNNSHQKKSSNTYSAYTILSSLYSLV